MNTANYHSGNENRSPFFDFIMYAVAIFLMVMVLFLFGGCNMQKYCAEHFPPTVERRDSISYIEIEKLTTDTVMLPGEGFIIIDSIPCDENNKAQLPEKKVKTNRGQLSITVKDGKLKADCKTDSLLAIIATKDRTITQMKEHQQTDVKTVFVKTKFDRFCNWFFWVVCALIVGFVVAKLLKVYAKIQVPFLK